MGKTITAPSDDVIAITPDDDNDLAEGACRSIYVGGDGNIKLDTAKGQTVTVVGLVAGDLLPIMAKRVHATDTTATNLLALY